MRVLLVEDEARLAEALRRGLSAENFVVELAREGRDGLHRAMNGEFDVIVLDIMLPNLSGYDICRELRRAKDLTPIMMLSAKDGEYDLADAFDLGADDYLTKPFSFVVLVARLRSLVRRAGHARPAVVEAGDLMLDMTRHCVTLRGQELSLTPREFDLLRYLMAHSDQLVSKKDVAAHVWDSHLEGDHNMVEVYIGYLRKKLGPAPRRIETVRGLGYRLRTQPAP